MKRLLGYLATHQLRALLGSVLVLALATGAGALVYGCHGGGATAGAHVQKYYCPMHPTYVTNEPGDCPICNMKLVPLEEKGGSPGVAGVAGGTDAEPGTPPPTAAAPAPAPHTVLYYRNPMDPAVHSPVPMKDPMGMDYVPVYADEAPPVTSGVPGMAAVQVGDQGVRLGGVRTVAAVRGTVARPTRTVGLVVPDERRIHHVHTRISGWVEHLHVATTGEAVRAGEPILGLYSPELLASQEELVRAKAAAARFATSSIPEVRRGGEELVAAARQRLELFDVPESVIAQVERTGKAQHTVYLIAPVSGYVTAKDVFDGQEVQPGMELFTITDLARVWVEADFYESEAPLLRLGQPAEIRLPYDAGRALRGTVSFISPTLDPASRTLKVRIELDNRDGLLKPGMYVDVLSGLGSAEGVSVPDDAVIDTGARQVVFVEEQPGVFAPREVRVGVRGNGQALVLAGVREGEKVATRAAFLLDSESRLRAAVANLGGRP